MSSSSSLVEGALPPQQEAGEPAAQAHVEQEADAQQGEQRPEETEPAVAGGGGDDESAEEGEINLVS